MRNLLKLFQDNAGTGRGYEIRAEGEAATVYLYDAVGAWYGIDAQTFVRDLNAVTAATVHLRINSPGGDVFDARAIATAVRQHKARIIAHIDGLAASAATYIALAAAEVEIAKGGFFMIHNAWTLAMGNAAELRELAVLLDKVDQGILADYRAKTGKDETAIRDWMAAETWFTAEEALEHGFVDRIAEGATAAESRWNLSAYERAPAALTERRSPEPAFDRARAERRLRLLERSA